MIELNYVDTSVQSIKLNVNSLLLRLINLMKMHFKCDLIFGLVRTNEINIYTSKPLGSANNFSKYYLNRITYITIVRNGCPPN